MGPHLTAKHHYRHHGNESAVSLAITTEILTTRGDWTEDWTQGWTLEISPHHPLTPPTVLVRLGICILGLLICILSVGSLQSVVKHSAVWCSGVIDSH